MLKKVVICIILKEKQIMLQLRDNKKNILYPNKWGFFGGDIKSGEQHLESVKREMKEELNIKNFKKLKFVKIYFDATTNSLFHIYILRLHENVVQNEGVDYDFFLDYQFLKKRKSKKLGKFFECADVRLMKIFANFAKRFF